MTRRHAAILNFHGDPNIGLYGIATDKFCLLGRSVPESAVELIKEVLNVPVYQLSLYGTDLIGLFASASSNCVILPSIIYESELKKLESNLAEIGVNVKVIETEYTAFGNVLLLNDKAGIASAEIPVKALNKIKNALGLKLHQMDLGKTSVPGSMGVITNKGGMFNPNLSDAEINKIENLFGFEIGLGTVNMGNPFISSGIIANSHGFIVGGMSSGYEIARIDESLGFIEK